MFNTVRKKLGFLYTKIYFKHERDAITDFTRAISNARVALVLLPNDQREFQFARSIVPSLQKKFKGNRLTVVVPEQVKDPMRDVYLCEIIRVHEHDLNPIFLPKENLRRRIREKNYDVAVDLNIQLHLPSAFLERFVGVSPSQKLIFVKITMSPIMFLLIPRWRRQIKLFISINHALDGPTTR